MITLNEVVPYEGRFGTIRGITINGVPWFVGKDVALALGYAKPSNAIYDHVDPEDKQFVMIDNLKDMLQPQGISQCRVALINESGVYALVLRSSLPAAIKFQDWVFKEVLPSIKKYGMYPPPAIMLNRWLEDPEGALAILNTLKHNNNNNNNNNITIEV